MDKNNIEYTRVWRINGNTLVVARSIEKAIEIFKTRYEFPYNDINSIDKIVASELYKEEDTALIYIEEKVN